MCVCIRPERTIGCVHVCVKIPQQLKVIYKYIEELIHNMTCHNLLLSCVCINSCISVIIPLSSHLTHVISTVQNDLRHILTSLFHF